MNGTKTVMRGFAAGAALMYFADPDRGRRRRALIRDKAIAAFHDVTNELEKARRDALNRAHGLMCGTRALWRREEADNSILVDRVRSRIGRAVSHPHAITVIPEADGRIILEGPVLEHELDYLLKAVRAVPGVKEVVNRLEPHREPDHISSLQGGVQRRQLPELAQENWAPTLRVAAGAVAGWAFYSSLRKDGPMRWLGTAVGTALLARAVANKGFRQILGVGGPAVDFEKTIHIHAPVEEVFGFWANFENFPQFMTHLKEVRSLGNGKWHWVAAGPAGISIPWDAEITKSEPNQLLAWRSVPGSLIETAGVVRFDPEPDGRTRLSIRMWYSPPAGVFGHAVAHLFGADPKSEIDDDMVRFKSLIEVGKTRAHGVTVVREQIGAGSRRGKTKRGSG